MFVILYVLFFKSNFFYFFIYIYIYINMAKSRINKMRTQKRVKRKTQKRMNKRKNKIYKKSKKINKYFYSGGSSNRQRPRTRGGSGSGSQRGLHRGKPLGEIGRKTEKLLLNYLSARGRDYQAARDTSGFIQVEDMLHVFRLIQVVEVRLKINPEINKSRDYYDGSLNTGETVNMNIYTDDAWPREDAYGEAQLLNAEYIGELLTWMDSAAFLNTVEGTGRTWAQIIVRDAGASIQGFDDEHEQTNAKAAANKNLKMPYTLSGSYTPYLTFPDENIHIEPEEKNRLAKERMQEGLKTLLAQGVIDLSNGDALSVINQVAGVFGEGVESQARKNLLTDAVDAFLDQYPKHDDQIIISTIIHDKVSAGAVAERMHHRFHTTDDASVDGAPVDEASVDDASVDFLANLRRQATQRTMQAAGLPLEEEGEE
jgi:hypothetical protein